MPSPLAVESSSRGVAIEEHWTCKKCTLVNAVTENACIVCGGSKLKSITSIEDMTLRRGEFWTCSKCTLKNSLSIGVCSAGKAVRALPLEERIREVDIGEGQLASQLQLLYLIRRIDKEVSLVRILKKALDVR